MTTPRARMSVCWLAAWCAAGMFVGQSATARQPDEPLEHVLGDYAAFLRTLGTLDDLTDADSSGWIAAVEDALNQSADPVLRQSGWEVIISLHNAREEWPESLNACDIAISAAVTDQALFDRLLDRYAVLLEMEPGAQDPGAGRQVQTDDCAMRIVEVYDRLWGENGSPAAFSRWPSYLALTWGMALGGPSADTQARVALLQSVLSKAEHPGVAGATSAAGLQNLRGWTAGLALSSDIEHAHDLIAAKDSGTPSNEITLSVALGAASSVSVPLLQQNTFLWRCEGMLGDHAWVSICTGHAMEALRAEEAGPEREPAPDENPLVGGVPVDDLIYLLDPTVSKLLGQGLAKSLGTNPTKAEIQRQVTLRTATWVLSQLHEIRGNADIAEWYRSSFKRVPFARPDPLLIHP